MANFFDQFDQPSTPDNPAVAQQPQQATPPASPSTPNFFDQFDKPQEQNENLQQEIQSNFEKMRGDYPGKEQDIANQQQVRGQTQGPSLPDPSTIMYDGIKDPKDAQALYDTYKNNPEATTNPITGEVYYHNKVVPYPELTVNSSGVRPYVSTTQDVFYGFPRNAGKELLKAGAVGIDYAGRALGFDPQLGKAVDENIPSYPSEGFKHNLGTEGPGILMGGVGGEMATAKVASKVASEWPKVAQIVTKLVKPIVAGAGATIPMSENTKPFVMGDNAMWPMLKGVPINKEGDYDQAFLAKKMNLLLDAALVAKPLEVGGRATAWTGSFIWNMTGAPLVKFLGKSAQEKAIWNNIANELANYTPTSTKEQTEQIKQNIINIVNNNKDYMLKQMQQGPSLQEVTMARDTMSAIEKGAQSPEMLSIARELRAGQRAGGSPMLEEKMAELPNHAEEFTNQMHSQFGGETGINQAKEGIQTEGINRVTEAQVRPILTQQQINDAERNVATLVKGDPTLGPALERLGGQVGIDVNQLRHQSEDQIIQTLRSSYEEMRQHASDLYKAIPTGARVDTRSLNAAVKLSGIKNLDPATAKLITAAKGDFSSLYQNVVPRLSANITSFYRAGRIPEGDALKALRDNITDHQLDYLISHGSEEVANAATAARDYFKNEFAPIWRDGALEKFADLHASTVTRGGIKPVQFRQGALDIVNSSLNDNKREYASHIIDALDNAGQPDLAVTYQLGQLASNLEEKLSNGAKISDLNPSDFLGSLQKMGSVISQKYPQQAERINQFINNFRNAKGNIADLQTQLKQYQQEAKDVENRVLGSELKDFFTRQGGEFKELNDGFTIFNKMIGDPEKAPDLIRIIQNNRNDSTVLTGLKAAYGRYLSEHAFGVGESSAGGRNLESKFIQSLSNPENPVWKTGEAIFQDHPEILDATKTLMSELQHTVASKGASTTAVEPGSRFATGARKASEFLTTMIWGVLSRSGARIRQLASRGITKLDPTQQAEKIMDQMFADPDYFTQVGQQVVNDLKSQIPQQAKKAAWRWMVRAGLYESHDKQGQSTYDDFSKIWDELNTDNQMSDAFKETGGSANRENPLDITVTPKDKK